MAKKRKASSARAAPKKASAPKRSGAPAALGSWSFLVGVILAVILGLGLGGAYQTTMLWTVFILGIIVGLLNVAHNEVDAFLTSGTVLVLISFLGIQVGVFSQVAPVISNVLMGILTLFVPATIIVALKAAFVLARN
jgi:F0F1-type ATP synthase assembly protein I